jgi:hypothetical protein
LAAPGRDVGGLLDRQTKQEHLLLGTAAAVGRGIAAAAGLSPRGTIATEEGDGGIESDEEEDGDLPTLHPRGDLPPPLLDGGDGKQRT